MASMRRKKIWLTITAAICSGVSACRPANDHASGLSYVANGDFACATYDSERLSYIKGLPPSFLSGFTADQMDVAISRVAGISDRDLNHLLWTHETKVFSGIRPGNLFFGVAGVTTLSSGQTRGGFRGSIGRSIATGGTSSGFALQHEIGHALEIVAREAAQKTAYSDFDGALRKMVSDFSSKASLTRSYARSSPGEAWAEAYANYHCSAATQSFLETNFPDSFKFLVAVLPPARWAGLSPTMPGAITAGQPAPAAGAPAPAPAAGGTPATIAAANVGGTQVGGAASSGEPAAVPSGAVGAWLDALLQKYYPAVLSANGPATTSSAIQEAGKNNLIRLALADVGDSGSVTALLFAAEAGIDQILFCFSDEKSCEAKTVLTSDEQVFVISRHQNLGARGLFTQRYFRRDQARYLASPWYALGYGQDGKLVGLRKLSIYETIK